MLEKAIAKRNGAIELAKLDVDGAPNLSRTYAIQSIPAVKAFKDGQVAAEFIGAQPPAAVEKFLDSLLPSQADQLVALGDEQSLRQAVALEPTRADAAVPLARILYGRGDADGALALVREVPRQLRRRRPRGPHRARSPPLPGTGPQRRLRRAGQR